MPLNSADADKVQAWLQAKCTAMVCPCCGSNTWGPGELGAMLPMQGGNLTFNGSTTPVVPIVCQVCGFVRFFSAIMLGLVAPDQPPSDPPR